MRSNQPAIARHAAAPGGILIRQAWNAFGGAAPAARPGSVVARDRRRPDDFWTLLIGSIDALLRAYHGIFEFTDDPVCVLRLGIGSADEARILADGTAIRDGEPTGALHLWNEHLPRYSSNGPDVAWACHMRRRVVRSLQLLADFVERTPAWEDVRAFRGAVNLSPRLRTLQVGRLASRLGFEVAEPPLTLARRLHFLGDCFNTWALTRAFNPTALPRQRFLRGRCELWISREALLARYGRAPRGRSARAARRQR